MQGWVREEGHCSTGAAGVDVSKHELVVALAGASAVMRFSNDTAGHGELCRGMSKAQRQDGPLRVGLEASGGYERRIAAALRKAGLEVIVFQPAQVRAYAHYLGQRAKTDPIDARLIALCTAAYQGRARQVDPRIAQLAEHLTYIEQIEEDIARLKTRLDGFAAGHFKSLIEADIKRLKQRRAAAIRALVKALRGHPDLGRRLDLVAGIDGIGERTALALLIRMPELGSMTREQAASLAGLAPFDVQSGKSDRIRHIQGGRTRVRRSIYAAALPAAFNWNAAIIDLYQRLMAKGKNHKRALVACARKLVIYANAVLQRGTPWTKTIPNQ